jgi:hypothetical protein
VRFVAALALALGLIAGARTARAVPLPVAAEARGVTVRAESGMDDLARELVGGARAHLDAIALDLEELPRPRDVEVRLVSDAADMQSVAPSDRRVPVWAAGVAFPDLGLVIVAARRKGQILDVKETLKHELAHLALGAALGDAAPRWLHEGFAYQHSAEWTWERTETLAGMAWGGSVIPLEQLDQQFPAEELPANRAYAESYDFVGYLAHRGRYEDRDDDGDRFPFRRFLWLVAQGETVDQAATHAFGRPIKLLFEEWREDLSRRYLLLPAGVFAALIWIFAAVLLTLAFFRRRRQRRARLAEWERQEAEAEARRAAWLATLRDVDWDPDPDPDDRPPPGLLN